MARQLGITGLRFRNWLRVQKADGHSLLVGHQHGERWEFSRAEADLLIAQYRASKGHSHGNRRGRSSRRNPSASEPHDAGSQDDCAAELSLSVDPGHRTTETWMSEEVTTLADLLRPGLRGVVVGINPSPVSVAAGHYYQGAFGQRFFAGLTQAGVLPTGSGFEDDRAYSAGLGFTDLSKRPTARAHELPKDELHRGRSLLEGRLRALRIPRIIFTFKKSAVVLLGRFQGFGVIGRRLFGAEVFVMSGPMAPADHRERAIPELRDWWREPEADRASSANRPLPRLHSCGSGGPVERDRLGRDVEVASPYLGVIVRWG